MHVFGHSISSSVFEDGRLVVLDANEVKLPLFRGCVVSSYSFNSKLAVPALGNGMMSTRFSHNAYVCRDRYSSLLFRLVILLAFVIIAILFGMGVILCRYRDVNHAKMGLLAQDGLFNPGSTPVIGISPASCRQVVAFQ